MTKTCKDVKERYEADLLALYEELEERYGLVLAQQIVDEIRKAESKDYVPEYGAAKSMSEVVEFIRPKALEASKVLRQVKSETSNLPNGVESLNVKRAEQNVERLCRAYLLAKGVYWNFYTRILTDIEKHSYKPKHYYVDMPRNPETATLGKAA